jgi:hypothetical protein
MMMRGLTNLKNECKSLSIAWTSVKVTELLNARREQINNKITLQGAAEKEIPAPSFQF